MFTNSYDADRKGESNNSPGKFKMRRNNKQQEREGAGLIDFVRNVAFDLELKTQGDL